MEKEKGMLPILIAFVVAAFFLYLLLQLIESLGKDVPIYRCPRCNALVRKYQEKCSRCGVKLIWSNPGEGTRPKEVGRVAGKAWWAGFIVLLFSLVMLAICTVMHLDQQTWCSILQLSMGYVIGVPVGASTAK